MEYLPAGILAVALEHIPALRSKIQRNILGLSSFDDVTKLGHALIKQSCDCLKNDFRGSKVILSWTYFLLGDQLTCPKMN